MSHAGPSREGREEREGNGATASRYLELTMADVVDKLFGGSFPRPGAPFHFGHVLACDADGGHLLLEVQDYLMETGVRYRLTIRRREDGCILEVMDCVPATKLVFAMASLAQVLGV